VSTRTAPTAFYCVADAAYFLGAVGMINSLRLQDHDEPIYLLDLGLERWQRELLAAEVTIVPAPAQTPPHLAKTYAPRKHLADVKILIDTDMIVTRPLDELIGRAARGKVIGFRDRQQRHFAEWGELGLGDPRATPYVSSGLVFLGGEPGAEAIELLADHQDKVDYSRTFWRANDRTYPYLYADQDMLNAIIATRVEPDRFLALEARLSSTPPFRRLRLVDEHALRCAYPDGVEPYVLHQFVRKPWLEPMYHGAYSRLLARLLLANDLAIKVPPKTVPLRMRAGVRARAERALVNVRDLGRYYLGDVIPAWIGTRLEDRRRRREARG
jgi:hypothetical protein